MWRTNIVDGHRKPNPICPIESEDDQNIQNLQACLLNWHFSIKGSASVGGGGGSK